MRRDMESAKGTGRTGGWRHAAAAGLLALAACSRSPDRDAGVIRVWAHQGQEAENAALRGIVHAFNEAHRAEGLRVEMTFFPDFQYTEKIAAAAAAGDLPDVLEVDGPTLAQFVDAELLQPLDPWVPDEDRADFLETILQQGTIGDRLYALGAFESAMALYFDREMLEQAGIRPPEPDGAWTWEEFVEACRALREAGMDPVAFHMNESADEWFTYAFSPLIWSVGGRLIDEETGQAEGVLNTPDNAEALRAWQRLFEADFAATDPVNPNPFGTGETAMDWTGHWMARSHLEAKGARLGTMPLPLPGNRPAAPCGSWCWALTAGARGADAGARWILWVTDRETGIRPMVKANGAIPARHSSLEDFPEYREPPFRALRENLLRAGRPRPRTPHYPALTQHFAAALRDIARGAEPGARLTQAAGEIQRTVDRARRRGP